MTFLSFNITRHLAPNPDSSARPSPATELASAGNQISEQIE
jgi:hypothetical protein